MGKHIGVINNVYKSKGVIDVTPVSDKNSTDERGRRTRKRLRGVFSGKKGKAVGIGSLFAPVVGLIVNDLRKPDSFIRRLVGRTATKLLQGSNKKREAIDITDKVEVIEDKKDDYQP